MTNDYDHDHDQRMTPDREFKIVMSGQFRTLAMFLMKSISFVVPLCVNLHLYITQPNARLYNLHLTDIHHTRHPPHYVNIWCDGCPILHTVWWMSGVVDVLFLQTVGWMSCVADVLFYTL